MSAGSLDDRLSRLERENRRLKLLGGTAMLFLVALVAMGQAAPERLPESVVARKFQVLNDARQVMAELGIGEFGTARLAIYDREGRKVWEAPGAAEPEPRGATPPNPFADGGKAPGAAPEATFEALKRIVAGRDLDALIDLISPRDMERMGRRWQENLEGEERDEFLSEYAEELGTTPERLAGMTFREFLVAMLTRLVEEDPEEFEAMGRATFVRAEIEGDEAEVTVLLQGREEDLDMVRVDGLWYLSGLDVF